MDRFERLLKPRSIAVIGGGAWCRSVIEQNIALGFAGDLWPVHPTKQAVSGIQAFASIGDLPSCPDAAFIGINRFKTIEAVAELSIMGCGGVVCFASGFREAKAEYEGAEALQNQLLSAADEMPLIGPNCYGLINYLDGAALWPDQQGGRRVECGVAIITQSSNIALNITAQRRGLPIAYIATVGNQAQINLAVLAQAMLHDDRVTALGLHIEGFADIRDFEALALQARSMGKAIVALKVGKSASARQATFSHTASIAGSDAGASALLERLGIARVASLPVMLETLKVLHMCGVLESNKIASMSCSGGEACLMGDAAEDRDVVFPPLNANQQQGLRNALGSLVALANPLDYHTYVWGDEAAITKTCEAIASPDLAMVVVIIDFPASGIDDEAWFVVARAAQKASKAKGMHFALVSTLQETLPSAYADSMMGEGLLVFSGIDEALMAIEAAYRIGKAWVDSTPVLMPKLYDDDKDKEHVLSEAEGKAELAAYGLNIPANNRADTPEIAATIAEEIGFPVVLKGEGIAHKSDVGAVVIGLRTSEEVEKAARALPTTSYLVEAMVEGALAELLVGVVRDPAHGFVLTLAAGGVLTELIGESHSLLIPSNRDAVDKALSALKVDKLLKGFRGKPAANREAILDQVMAMQSFVMDHHERLLELEVNPLIATETQAYAVDVLMKTRLI